MNEDAPDTDPPVPAAAGSARAPAWLNEAARLLAAGAAAVPPIETASDDLTEFIYRH